MLKVCKIVLKKDAITPNFYQQSLSFACSVKYSGCQYADGEEITGTTGTWEASVENMQADKVEEQKKRNKETKREIMKKKKTGKRKQNKDKKKDFVDRDIPASIDYAHVQSDKVKDEELSYRQLKVLKDAKSRLTRIGFSENIQADKVEDEELLKSFRVLKHSRISREK